MPPTAFPTVRQTFAPSALPTVDAIAALKPSAPPVPLILSNTLNPGQIAAIVACFVIFFACFGAGYFYLKAHFKREAEAELVAAARLQDELNRRSTRVVSTASFSSPLPPSRPTSFRGDFALTENPMYASPYGGAPASSIPPAPTSPPLQRPESIRVTNSDPKLVAESHANDAFKRFSQKHLA